MILGKFQFAKENIEPLIKTKHFKDEYESWEEKVEIYKTQAVFFSV